MNADGLAKHASKGLQLWKTNLCSLILNNFFFSDGIDEDFSTVIHNQYELVLYVPSV